MSEASDIAWVQKALDQEEAPTLATQLRLQVQKILVKHLKTLRIMGRGPLRTTFKALGVTWVISNVTDDDGYLYVQLRSAMHEAIPNQYEPINCVIDAREVLG